MSVVAPPQAATANENEKARRGRRAERDVGALEPIMVGAPSKSCALLKHKYFNKLTLFVNRTLSHLLAQDGMGGPERTLRWC